METRTGSRGTRLPGRPTVRSPEEMGNRTMAVGLMVLQTVARMASPPSVSEVAHALGMPAARASRYLSSLTQSGFLRHDALTGRFDLGSAVIELGMLAMARTDAIRLALELMRPLTQETGLVSILYVWGSNGPTAIKWEQGPQYVPIRLREGLNISVLVTAAGRIFLAYHDPGEVRPILQKDLKDWNSRAAPGRKFSMKDVEALKEEVRERGMAQTVALNNPAIAALAAPIFGPEGLVMVLTTVGVIGSFDPSHTGPAARALKATADKLSAMLGGGAALAARKAG
jgi:DNA-binding IclR family transcriptional regulator